MIKFITEEDKEEKSPVYGDVEANQFFISDSGCLSQKIHSHRYNTISDACGTPFSRTICAVNDGLSIQKVLPKITKIEF